MDAALVDLADVDPVAPVALVALVVVVDAPAVLVARAVAADVTRSPTCTKT